MFYAKDVEPLRQDDFEARLVAALEQQPTVEVSPAFAAKVAVALPAAPPRRRVVHAGRVAAMASVAVLLMVVLWLAPHSVPDLRNIAFCVEMAAIAAMAMIALWLSRSWSRA
ncbi:hypothetical protein ACFQBQ_11665 [Granulicella cerasi]|uniref:Uncharacterized protein n=1 Tax=Granulicella cerasi TaxID=741063 RepID=A0ABW1ZBK5_9BACT|nr:hypothetical protein [Granulicella cerasi]